MVGLVFNWPLYTSTLLHSSPLIRKPCVSVFVPLQENDRASRDILRSCTFLSKSNQSYYLVLRKHSYRTRPTFRIDRGWTAGPAYKFAWPELFRGSRVCSKWYK